MLNISGCLFSRQTQYISYRKTCLVKRGRTKSHCARRVSEIQREKRLVKLGFWYGYFTIIIGVLAVVISQSSAINASSFTVNSTDDIIDANPGDGVCETALSNSICTLRAAIQEANAYTGTNTIILPAGVYTLTLSGRDEDSAVTGDLDIIDRLIIRGEVANLSIINGNDIDRVFDIFDGANVTVSDITIENGNVPPFLPGGAVYVHANSVLSLTNSIIKNNYGFWGGGINIESGSSATIFNGAIVDNDAEIGGGIYSSGILTLSNSTVSGNSAYGPGGIDVRSAGATYLVNVTISNNDTVPGYGDGGGIAGDATIKNSIIANNFDSAAPDCAGTLVSEGHNLIRNTTGCTITGNSAGNLLGVAPMLGVLQDNDGNTLTHALLPGSPAIDAGSNSGCTVVDQRGFKRPEDGDLDGNAMCDIGAYEYQVPYHNFLPLIVENN